MHSHQQKSIGKCVILLPTGLSTCDDIMALENCRKAIGLDGSRHSIASKLDILQHDGMQASILKGAHRLDLGGALLDDVDHFDAKSDQFRSLIRQDRGHSLLELYASSDMVLRAEELLFKFWKMRSDIAIFITPFIL